MSLHSLEPLGILTLTQSDRELLSRIESDAQRYLLDEALRDAPKGWNGPMSAAEVDELARIQPQNGRTVPHEI